jgi:uncharacterized protein
MNVNDNARDGMGSMPLHSRPKEKRKELCACLLLDFAADANTKNNNGENRCTAPWRTRLRQMPPRVLLLREHGANPTVVAHDGS